MLGRGQRTADSRERAGPPPAPEEGSPSLWARTTGLAHGGFKDTIPSAGVWAVAPSAGLSPGWGEGAGGVTHPEAAPSRCV